MIFPVAQSLSGVHQDGITSLKFSLLVQPGNGLNSALEKNTINLRLETAWLMVPEDEDEAGMNLLPLHCCYDALLPPCWIPESCGITVAADKASLTVIKTLGAQPT